MASASVSVSINGVSAHARGKTVAVHCYAGLSRSVAIVLAYMIYKGMSLVEATRLVSSLRPINVNIGFVAQLQEYEKRLVEKRKPGQNAGGEQESKVCADVCATAP
jgi:protein-tyrosine phosphatase